MGLFSSKKSESISVEEFAEMAEASDRKLKDMIASGRVPQRTAKELKKAAKDFVRASEGERGARALAAGLKGGGSGNRNHQNIPLKERMHPAAYKALLEKEARKQRLI